MLSKLEILEQMKAGNISTEAAMQMLDALPKAKIEIKVSQKQAVQVSGVNGWPVTLYKDQWRVLNELMPRIMDFIGVNDKQLITKAQAKARGDKE